MSKLANSDRFVKDAPYQIVCGGPSAGAAAGALAWVRANVLRECDVQNVESQCTEPSSLNPFNWFSDAAPVCAYPGTGFAYAGIVLGRAKTDRAFGEVLADMRASVSSGNLLAEVPQASAELRCDIAEITDAVKERIDRATDLVGDGVDTVIGAGETAVGVAQGTQGVLGAFFGARGPWVAAIAWAGTGLLVWKVGPMVLRGVERTAKTAVNVIPAKKALGALK